MTRKKKKKEHRELSPPMPASTPPDASDTAPTARRQPVIIKEAKAGRVARRCAEMAGNAAANCAAVCCCCPCGLLKLLLEASVRMPAVLYRRARWAMARRRERAKKRKVAMMLDPIAGMTMNANSLARAEWPEWPEGTAAEAVAEKDREMEAWFANAGFWRGHDGDDEGGDDT